MIAFSPEQKRIAAMVHQVDEEIARGDVTIEGTGAMWKYAFVRVVSQRLEGVSLEMNHAVYDVLRLMEQGEGQPQ